MKRFTLIIPVSLFAFLIACGNQAGEISPAQWTAVWQTQTATLWTPTITTTPDPSENKIVEWLNAEFSSAEPLEQTLDATYRAVDASFPIMPDGASTVFRVDIRCECATYSQCCNPERMFVAVMDAMKKRTDRIMEQVPGSVMQMKVVCYDHTAQLGVVAAWWSDAGGYLRGEINGYQFGSRVWRGSLP